jgi:hypothetical protein
LAPPEPELEKEFGDLIIVIVPRTPSLQAALTYSALTTSLGRRLERSRHEHTDSTSCRRRRLALHHVGARSALPAEQRAELLIAAMTLEQKVEQLSNDTRPAELAANRPPCHLHHH